MKGESVMKGYYQEPFAQDSVKRAAIDELKKMKKVYEDIDSVVVTWATEIIEILEDNLVKDDNQD